MKSEIQSAPVLSTKFPRLFRSRDNGQIVMALAEKKGVVVFGSTTNLSYPIGARKDCWVDFNNLEIWEPFMGNAVLEND